MTIRYQQVCRGLNTMFVNSYREPCYYDSEMLLTRRGEVYRDIPRPFFINIIALKMAYSLRCTVRSSPYTHIYKTDAQILSAHG